MPLTSTVPLAINLPTYMYMQTVFETVFYATYETCIISLWILVCIFFLTYHIACYKL